MSPRLRPAGRERSLSIAPLAQAAMPVKCSPPAAVFPLLLLPLLLGPGGMPQANVGSSSRAWHQHSSQPGLLHLLHAPHSLPPPDHPHSSPPPPAPLKSSLERERRCVRSQRGSIHAPSRRPPRRVCLVPRVAHAQTPGPPFALALETRLGSQELPGRLHHTAGRPRRARILPIVSRRGR